MSRGSSAHTIACGSNTTRCPASCTLKVVNVSSASDDVSISPPIASRLSRRSSWEPPARQACAPSTFCARRAPACALMYSNEMKRFMKFAGRLPSLMYAVTAPTVGSARWRTIRRSERNVKITSASITSTASYQPSPRRWRSPWLSVCALPSPPLARRRWKTRPGCSAAFACTTSGVSSVLASSTT